MEDVFYLLDLPTTLAFDTLCFPFDVLADIMEPHLRAEREAQSTLRALGYFRRQLTEYSAAGDRRMVESCATDAVGFFHFHKDCPPGSLHRAAAAEALFLAELHAPGIRQRFVDDGKRCHKCAVLDPAR